MELKQENIGGTVVVHCLGERLDSLVAIKFKDEFRQLAGEDAQRVVLNMGAVKFMDSSCLGAVVAVFKLLGPDRVFDLACLTPAVDRVFRLTRMDSVFSIFDSVDAAVAAPPKSAMFI